MPLPCVLGPLTMCYPWGLGQILPLEKPHLNFWQLLRDPVLPALGPLCTGQQSSLCPLLPAVPDPGVREMGNFRSDIRTPFLFQHDLILACLSLVELGGGRWMTMTLQHKMVGRVLQPAMAQEAFPCCSSHTCALWRALAVEPSLTTQVVGLLLEKMNRDVPFKESRAFLLGSTADRVATLLPLAVSKGLRGYLACCPCPHMRPGYPKGTWQLCWGS